MSAERVHFDGTVDGLAALGIESVEQLLEPRALPIRRAQELPPRPPRTRLRFPLPGTEDAEGRMSGRPGGAGTGWVVLDLWRATPWRPLVRSRLTAPRSASLAERTWNLLCHLRARGVGTPEPLAVGASGNGPVSRDSFLVTRELVGFESLPAWLARPHRPDARRRAITAIGTMLANLVSSGVYLPRLAPDQILLSAVAEVDEDAACEHAAGPAGLSRNRMPSVVLTDVTDGILRPGPSAAEVTRMLQALLPEPGRASWRELLRVFSLATRHGFDRDERRAMLDTLANRARIARGNRSASVGIGK